MQAQRQCAGAGRHKGRQRGEYRGEHRGRHTGVYRETQGQALMQVQRHRGRWWTADIRRSAGAGKRRVQG